jgi:RNA ligase (TIGR02306 family)
MTDTMTTEDTTPMLQDLTDFHVEVQPVTKIEKHSNADTLSIGECCGAPVIFLTGEYLEGDLAAYIPIDSIVPADDARWAHLKGHWRIRAKKLRGIYSQGMLTKPDPTWPAGFDAREALRIEKYEPPIFYEGQGPNRALRGPSPGSEPNPGYLPHYGIESYRRHRTAIDIGEEVVCTEKVHGCQGSAIFRDGRLWVASHYNYKAFDETDQWWKAAIKYDLAAKLATVDGIGIFYEVFGHVQDLKYGAKPGELFIRVFDAYDSISKTWLNHHDLVNLCSAIGVKMVPTLYRGPWDPDALLPMANGASRIHGAANIREGFVVKPVVERETRSLGRVILKVVGSTYLLRKNG